MKIPFKKISVLTLCFAVCSALLRFLQLVFCIDPLTGFFKKGYSFFGTELGVAIFVFILFAFLFSFSASKLPKSAPEKTVSLAIGYLILAIGIIFDIIFCPTRQVVASWQNALFIFLGILCVIYFVFEFLLKFFHFSFLEKYNIKNNTLPPLFCIIPVLFYIIKTIIYFSFYTEIAIISDIVFEIFAMICVIFFFLFFARFQNGVHIIKTQKRLISVCVVTFISTLLSGLPKTALFVFGFSKYMHSFSINNISSLCVCAFVAIYYFNVFKNENLKAKAKKHIAKKTAF